MVGTQSLAYFTPIIGGVIADRFLGYRNATVIGALTMAIGAWSYGTRIF